MRRSVAVLALLWAPGLAWADAKLDPLRFVPAGVDLVVKLENPRQLYEAVVEHEVFQELLKFDAAQAVLDTTNFRRFLQLLGFFEKQLGFDRLDLLDRLTGGGVVVAARFSDKKARVLFVVQARDEKLLTRFVHLTRKVIDSELARQGSKDKVQVKAHRQVETLHFGPQLHVAQVGSALILASAEGALHRAIETSAGGPAGSLVEASLVGDAHKLLPDGLLLWGALNLEQVREIPDVKNALNSLGLDPITLFAVGGLVDVVKRAPFVCFGLARDGKNFHTRVAMPRGRDGMSPVAAIFLPPDERGSLPMLKPPRAQTCTSYYIDLARFWQERHKILTREQAEGLDKFEKETSKYLGKMSLGSVLQQTGKYHRIVTAQQGKSPYKKGPPQLGGAAALVLDMRDPAFAKSMGVLLRGAALAVTLKYGLKMVEEDHNGHTLVSYYFPENRKFDGDPDGFRFNFSPCFAHVGNQFVVSSTSELGRDLIDCLVKETAEGSSPASARTEAYAAGLADNLRSAEDFLVTQAILGQALPPGEARKQIERLIQLVSGLGTLQFETRYGKSDFRFDARWLYK